jgi:hypothetical protein
MFMRLTKMLSVAVCLFAVGVAFGQTTAPAPTTKPAGAILEQIPAGSMGFVVVPEVRSRTGQVDKFMEQIGQADAFKNAGVKGFLDFIQTQAKLGDGFNPDGGFAAVMLDMQQFKITAATLMSGHDENGEPLKLPYVLIVPGSSIDSVFSQYERATPPGATHVQVHLRMASLFAAASNGYVLLSPREDALDAAVQAKQNASSELPADQLKLIRSSAMTVYVNMKVAGPLVIKMIKQTEDMMAAMSAMGGRNAGGLEAMQMSMMSQVLPFYRQAVSQMDSGLIAAKFTDAGPTLQYRFTFVKDSEIAKSIAANRAIGKSMLSRLPNLNYILALEAAGAEMTPDKARAMGDQMDKLLADKFMADVPEASKARIKKLALDWNEQVQGMQLVFGGAPKNKGMFGFAMVLDCKDSKKAKDLLAEGTDLAADILIKKITDLVAPKLEGTEKPAGNQGGAQFAPPVAEAKDPSAAKTPATGPATTGPAEPPVKVVYKKDATKSGALSVDAIVISSPKLAENQKDLVKYIGDEQVRVLVAAPTDKLLVVTFGGAEEMMAAAIKTATDNSGDIVNKDSQAILDELPKQRTAVALFDLSNMFKMVKQVAAQESTDPAKAESIPQLDTHTPAAICVGLGDNTVEEFFLIPNAMIKDIIKAVQTATGMPPNGGAPVQPAQPKKPHEDF